MKKKLAKQWSIALIKYIRNLVLDYLKKVYEVCLTHELRKAGFAVARQLDIPIQYDGITFDEGLRLDMLVENKVIVEVKSLGSG